MIRFPTVEAPCSETDDSDVTSSDGRLATDGGVVADELSD